MALTVLCVLYSRDSELARRFRLPGLNWLRVYYLPIEYVNILTTVNV